MSARSVGRSYVVPFCGIALLVVACSVSLLAQTDPALETGLKPFGTYQGSNLDVVSTTTGRLHVHIPLLSYPQRGGRLHADYFIMYDSAALEKVCAQNCTYIQTPVPRPAAWITNDAVPGWNQTAVYREPNNQIYEGTIVNVVDPEGASHRMGAIPSSGATTQLRALDASGYYLNTPWATATIYDANGNSYTQSTQTASDAIGNTMTATNTGAITDTIGRSIPAPPTPQSAGCATWNVPGQNGGTVPYQLCYEQVGSRYVLQSVVLPNNTSYTFTYQQSSVDGTTITELQEIELPTGGTISYTYTTESSTCSQNLWRRVATRTVNDGNGNQWSWTYSRSTQNSTFTITDPLQNVAVHTFTELGSQICSIYETNYVQQDNAGHALRTVSTSYDSIPDSETTYLFYDVLSVVPYQITTTLNNGQQSVTTKNYPSTGFGFCSLASAPSYSVCTGAQQSSVALYVGNPSSVVDGDYSGSTLQTTTYYYLAPSNVNYLNNNQLNLKTEVQVTSPLGNGNTTFYCYDGDTSSNCQSGGAGYKGNLTKINKGLGAIYTKTYTGYGMLSQDKDPLSNTTTYAYDSTGLFVRSVTNALNMVTQYNYDADTGLLNYVIDPNNQETSYTYDEMNRPLSVSYPDGGSTGYSYDDSPATTSKTTPNVTVTEAITSSQNKEEIAIVDGLGRLIQSQLYSDPEGVDYVDVTYDGLGRKASASNPYRSHSDPTYGITQYQYDALNRLLTQTQPDQSTIQYSYSGNQTTVTDEAGKKRTTITNALDWLTSVTEDPNGYDYSTTYGYDGLGNLTGVTQTGANNRSFVYDSLSRLTSATNPEWGNNNVPGTTTYQYDTTSTLTSKTDNRPITITYHPDALHRITSKTYSDGEQTIYYCYDNNQSACNGTSSVSNGIGRRTGMTDASGNTSWSYDVIGRVAKTAQTIAGEAGETWYDYNLDGSLSDITYPDGDDMSYTYSNAARPVVANYDDLGDSFNYVTAATYTAAGLLTGYQGDTFGGDWVGTVANSYNNRLQPVVLSAGTGQGTIFSLTYNFNLGSSDNGNVYGITNNLNSCRSQTFSYDSLNRLVGGASSGSGSCSSAPNLWGDSYGYDNRGNLLNKTVTQGSGESWSNAVNANNQLDPSQGYDRAGNFTTVDGIQYNYFNAENQWTSQSTLNVSYLYDGDGHRVMASGGASGTRVYWYDVTGNVIEEDAQNGTVQNEYMYLRGQRIARVYQLFSGVYYYYGDNLGTSRVIADENGNKCYDGDYFPWGGEQYVFTNTCSQNYKFTSKERDPDMGIDDFGARFYKNTMARFYSPDWSATVEPVPYARLNNPQSLNLYTYVLDNPLSFRDADGHELGADTLQEVQKITSDSGNAAQKQGTDWKKVAKGGGEVVLGVVVTAATIAAAPTTGGSSLAAIPVVLGVLGGEGAAAKGVIDIANGSGAIDNKTGENGKQGIDIATNPASGAALVAGASPQTAQNIGNIANVAMGARDLTERPKGLLDSISKASSVNDIYQSVRELVKQVIASPCSGCESIAP